MEFSRFKYLVVACPQNILSLNQSASACFRPQISSKGHPLVFQFYNHIEGM